MSGTVAPVAPVSAPLAADLKAAVVAAADTHLASVQADVARVKNAVAADFAGVATVAEGEFRKAEHWVVAEFDALKAQLAKLKTTAAVGASGGGLAGLLWAAVHFGFLVF